MVVLEETWVRMGVIHRLPFVGGGVVGGLKPFREKRELCFSVELCVPGPGCLPRIYFHSAVPRYLLNLFVLFSPL